MKRIAPELFGILTSAVPHLIFPCRGRVSPPPSSPGLLQQLDGCLQPAVAARLEILIRKDRHGTRGLDADKVVCPSILRQIGAVRQSEAPAVGESSSHRLGEGPLGAVSNSGDVRLAAVLVASLALLPSGLFVPRDRPLVPPGLPSRTAS